MIPLFLLNWRVWALLGIVVVCGGALYKAYEMGGDEPRAELADYKAEQVEKALTASEQNRKTEQAMAAKLRKAQDDYAKLQKLNADSARDLDRVRGDFQTAINSRCTANPTAPGCVDGAGKLERELLGSCAQALGELAAEADGATAKVVGLQAYIKSITKD
jgi:multidrug resistance efflux pump